MGEREFVERMRTEGAPATQFVLVAVESTSSIERIAEVVARGVNREFHGSERVFFVEQIADPRHSAQSGRIAYVPVGMVPFDPIIADGEEPPGYVSPWGEALCPRCDAPLRDVSTRVRPRHGGAGTCDAHGRVSFEWRATERSEREKARAEAAADELARVVREAAEAPAWEYPPGEIQRIPAPSFEDPDASVPGGTLPADVPYMPDGYHSSLAPAAPLVCGVCGVLVRNRVAHDRWHRLVALIDRDARDVRDAHRAGAEIREGRSK
jgi:hypothetical protein